MYLRQACFKNRRFLICNFRKMSDSWDIFYRICSIVQVTGDAASVEYIY
jgi:hypothetical protein